MVGLSVSRSSGGGAHASRQARANVAKSTPDLAVDPVVVSPLVRWLDRPFLVIATAMTATFLARGRVGRIEGAVLVGLGLAFSSLNFVNA